MKFALKNIILPFCVRLENPVLIYQMGKVASSSINESLKSVSGLNVFHVHRLNPENIERVRQDHLRKGIKPQDEYMGVYLYQKVFKRKRPAKIISLIREPIGRNISAFFQNLDTFEGREDAHSDVALNKLINRFLKDYNHDVPLNWFDDELKKTTGIDVYGEKFPQETGYKTYYQEPFDLLLIRHDLDDRLKERLICDFLHLERITIVRANEGVEKNYADVYSTFLKNIQLPPEYIERMLSSRYAQHFFSTNELADLREKWTS